MHEVSLVRSLLTQVKQASQPTLPELVCRASVSIGPLSGVEPLLVQLAFDQLKCDYGLSECTLDIQEVSLQAVCRDCRAISTIENFLFRCAACGSTKLRITQGDEFQLLSVEVLREDGCRV